MHPRSPATAAFLCLVCLAVPVATRAQDTSLRNLSAQAAEAVIATTRPDTPVPVIVANRTVTVLRASILGRSSAERANGAILSVQAAADDGQSHTAGSRQVGPAAIITVDGLDLFAIVPADVDDLIGENITSKVAGTVARLQQTLDELAEARRPQLLLWGITQAVLVTLLFAAIVALLIRANRRAAAAVARATERQLSRLTVGDELVRRTRLLQYIRRSIGFLLMVAGVVVGYLWFTYVLRRFPYTRPWGESMRAVLVNRVSEFAHNSLAYLPDLFTVALIVIVTRLLARLLVLVFAGVEENRVHLAGVYPETAATTRKLATALLWAFALVIAYPYLPGSETEAFKGISVFIGLMVSLGSTGLINQVMSGFTLTYSRALRRGDFVRIGDTEGTVIHMGTLSTKLLTPRREEITIPNAVLIAQGVTNYSRNADAGVFIPTQVTIGYDAPWRKVESLLLGAAAATDGVRKAPAPMVLQLALEDFYVRYALLVCLDDTARRNLILNRLHANIQDLFNDSGVQIMSPHYETDPDAAKIVPRAQWHA